jgi:hypothetical protein
MCLDTIPLAALVDTAKDGELTKLLDALLHKHTPDPLPPPQIFHFDDYRTPKNRSGYEKPYKPAA